MTPDDRFRQQFSQLTNALQGLAGLLTYLKRTTEANVADLGTALAALERAMLAIDAIRRGGGTQ